MRWLPLKSADVPNVTGSERGEEKQAGSKGRATGLRDMETVATELWTAEKPFPLGPRPWSRGPMATECSASEDGGRDEEPTHDGWEGGTFTNHINHL